MPVSGDGRRSLRRAERAVGRMSDLEREVFLAIRVDELSYPEIAVKIGIGVAEVEQLFAASLAVLVKAMDENDPWWWKFLPW